MWYGSLQGCIMPTYASLMTCNLCWPLDTVPLGSHPSTDSSHPFSEEWFLSSSCMLCLAPELGELLMKWGPWILQDSSGKTSVASSQSADVFYTPRCCFSSAYSEINSVLRSSKEVLMADWCFLGEARNAIQQQPRTCHKAGGHQHGFNITKSWLMKPNIQLLDLEKDNCNRALFVHTDRE